MILGYFRFIFLTTFTVIVCSLQAQTIRYDTVPDPRKTHSERKLFSFDQPQEATKAQQQTTKQTTPQPEAKQGFDKNRLFFGGTFGLTFGDYTALNISPQIGYEVSKYFSWGGGAGYSYYRWKRAYPQSVSYNYLGLNLFGRLRPVQGIALQIQPEIYRLWGSHIDSRAVPCVLVGGGFYLPMGPGAVNTMIYYDLVQDAYSPYRNQIVYSVGYAFYF